MGMQDELINLSDEAWRRTRRRLEGLTDEEAWWEPAPGCWTVRPVGGSWETDWAVPAPTPPPMTTIAWRVVHLIGCYGSARNSRWLGFEDGDIELAPIEASLTPAPHTADELVAVLEQAHARWEAVLRAADDERLATLIGPIGGQYAEATRAGLVLHQLDEVVHHGAEVGVLRDIWDAQHRPVHEDPVIAGLLGSSGAVDGDAFTGAPAETLATLAAWGRWDLVDAALDAGVAPEDPTVAMPTALHRAAGTGRTAMVERLLAAGADRSRRDPTWNATPGEWAAFFGVKELAERLRDERSR